MIDKYLELLEQLFKGMLIEAPLAKDLAQGVGIITLLAISFLLFFLTKWLLKNVVGKLIRKSKTKYDDFFLGKKLEKRLAFLVPIYMINGLLYAFLFL